MAETEGRQLPSKSTVCSGPTALVGSVVLFGRTRQAVVVSEVGRGDRPKRATSSRCESRIVSAVFSRRCELEIIDDEMGDRGRVPRRDEGVMGVVAAKAVVEAISDGVDEEKKE